MKNALVAIGLTAALFATKAPAQTMQVSPNGTRPAMHGPAAVFTGTVTVTPLFAPNDQTNAGAGVVEFTRGARSHWRAHPAGQTLGVTAGTEWVQEEGSRKF